MVGPNISQMLQEMYDRSIHTDPDQRGEPINEWANMQLVLGIVLNPLLVNYAVSTSGYFVPPNEFVEKHGVIE